MKKINNSLRSRPTFLPLAVSLAVAALSLGGCNDAPTTALVENGYPAGGAAGGVMTIFKAWWVTTLFPKPVALGESSGTERTTPGNDYAYALVAPDWSVDDGGSPARLIALKSRQKLSAAAHDLLQITVSDEQFAGNCATGEPLSADDAELIVQRLFPGDFAAIAYDPTTCMSTSVTADAGTADASGDQNTPDAGTD
jgi:hypothetical protein